MMSPRARPVRLRRCLRVAAAMLLSCAALATRAAAQEFSWPFAIGEALTYQVRVSRVGDVGEGQMWIEGPVVEAGIPTWRLRFEIRAGKGPIRATDRTSSWIDPVTFGIVRFEKEERHVLSRSKESVRIDRGQHRWTDDIDGGGGALGHVKPLDELSFIYFLRTIDMSTDTLWRFERHFDASRNPTIVRLVGRDTLTTPAGIFRTRIIEMEVRDPKRYKGTGVIRIHLNEGECHMPIRIESRMPVLGVTTLTLSKFSHPPRYPVAVVC